MSGARSKLKRIAKETAELVVLGAVLVMLMLWLSGAFLSKIHPAPPETQPKPPTPKTYRVEKQSFPRIVKQVGTVRTRTQAQVSSRIMGQIREIPVEAGDMVTGPESGKAPATVLARLDDREIKARLQQSQAKVHAMERALSAAKAQQAVAQADLEAAQANAAQVLADYKRYENLYQKKAATGQELDHARARKEEADARVSAAKQQVTAAQKEIERTQAQQEESQAAVNQAQVALSYATIEAPFSGLVAQKLVDIGDMVNPGQTVLLLETPSEPELHAVVAQSLVSKLKRGASVRVGIDALGLSLQGTVRDIIPQAHAQTRTVTVKIAVPPHPDLFSGMSGHIDLESGLYEALVVPQAAVSEVGQLHLVKVLNSEGHIRRRFVTLGKHHGEMVEVLSGLHAGEEVVVP